MTREEAIVYGNDYYADLISACCKIDEKHKEFVRMSLEALEQEPCEDCISREEVCDYIAEFVNHEYATDREREMVKHIIGGIQHLQSVQPKTIGGDAISRAELLKHQRSIYDEHLMDYVDVVEVKCIEEMSSNKDIHECNNCHHFIDDGSNDKYCPCCGSRLGFEDEET